MLPQSGSCPKNARTCSASPSKLLHMSPAWSPGRPLRCRIESRGDLRHRAALKGVEQLGNLCHGPLSRQLQQAPVPQLKDDRLDCGSLRHHHPHERWRTGQRLLISQAQLTPPGVVGRLGKLFPLAELPYVSPASRLLCQKLPPPCFQRQIPLMFGHRLPPCTRRHHLTEAG